MQHETSKKITKAKKNNTLFPGNAGDEKNVHRGDRKKKIIDIIEFFK